MITQITGSAVPGGEAAGAEVTDGEMADGEVAADPGETASVIDATAAAAQGDFGLAAGRPFSGLRRAYLLNPSPDQTSFQVSAELLQFLLAKLALRVLVDEAFYRARYPDIGEAIEQGQFASARHHYIHYGYREDRMPHRITVDDAFYRTTYPDILQGLRSGRLASAQAHFDNFGFKEGRLPYEGWTLF